ncbi:MAG: D-2-hydroxyacid dehydrogenase [Nitrospinae bacterium]|nr:D-2-hydroxyacid dehydrogenase [Nitrospinota bacterium]
MNIAVLDARTLGDDIDLSSLETFGNLIIYPTTQKEETIKRVKQVDIVITNKVVIDQEVIDSSPSLKLICVAATGTNNIDTEYATKKGIIVKNVVGYSTDSVVQHTFASLFYLLESLNYYDTFVKSGDWSKSPIFTNHDRPYFELNNKVWGIIGLGAIGKKVATVANAFGCKVIYHSTSGVNLNGGFEHSSLHELLKTSDIISIHAPLNEQTENLIGKNELLLLKKGAIILNMGRGGIIHEGDLAEAVDTLDLYAGLDVLSKEPPLENNPLNMVERKERLLITPHIAWTSIEARQRLIQGISENIKTFLLS